MIQTSRRGLDPLQATAVDDSIPIDWNFRMPAKDIRTGQRVVDSLLPRIDQRRIRYGLLDTIEVVLFDWVAKNDIQGRLRQRTNPTAGMVRSLAW